MEMRKIRIKLLARRKELDREMLNIRLKCPDFFANIESHRQLKKQN